MLNSKWIQTHLRLRWLGVPLFFTGLAELAYAIYGLSTGALTWHVVLWAFGATATSLATFGSHTENALARMQALKPAELTQSMRAELNWELKRNRTATLSLSSTPGTSVIVTLLAITMHTLTIVTLVTQNCAGC
jgi:hypothetical protein